MNAMNNGNAAKGAGDKRIRKIVIVGGGSAGWMAAAALSVGTQREGCQIVLVESDEIGIVGVGESTVPAIRQFNRFLGIDENEFVSKTQATFKVAIEFVDWTRIGHSYFNPLAAQGFSADADSSPAKLPPFYQFLMKFAVDGEAPDLDNYELCSLAARRNRFARPGNSAEAMFSYAFQFDASLYAKYCATTQNSAACCALRARSSTSSCAARTASSMRSCSSRDSESRAISSSIVPDSVRCL